MRAQRPATVSVAAPPITTAGTIPHQAAVSPDSNSPSSFEAPMKTEFTALTRPANLVRRLQLDQQMPDVDAHHVAGAHDDERGQAHGRLVDSPNTIVATPNAATPPNIHRPTWRRIGRIDTDSGEQRRADGRSGAHHAEADRPDVEDLARVDREQCRRPAEQHREQVERDRAEHDRPRADERHPGQQRRPRDGLASDSSSRPPPRRPDTSTTPATIRTHGQPHRRRSTPSRTSAPPSAGPAIVATCPSDEFSATARGNVPGGAMFGRSAWPVGWLNARAMPKTTMTPSTGAMSVTPASESASSAAAQTPRRTYVSSWTRRRS